MHLTKSEYVGDIVSSSTPGAFKIQTFTVNPGLFNLFPYGATIANSFAQYQYVNLRFRYVPTSGLTTGNPDPSLGSVAARFLYDPTDEVDDSYFMMVSQHGAHTSMTAVPFAYTCGVGSASARVQKVRTGSVPTGQDPRMFDLGIFEIATNGVPNAESNLGQLFVDYEVRLMKPVLIGGFRGGNALYGHWSTTTNDATANCFGTTAMTTVSDQNTITPYIPGYSPTAGPVGNELLLPESEITYRLLVSLRWNGNTAATVNIGGTPTVSSGVSFVPSGHTFNNTLANFTVAPQSGVSSNNMAISFVVEVAGGTIEPKVTMLGSLVVPSGGAQVAEVEMLVIPYNAY